MAPATGRIDVDVTLERTGSRASRWRALMPNRPLARIFAAAGLLSVLAFFWFARGGLEAASPAGMAFGVAAAVLLLLVMVYSVRRSMPSVRGLGPARPYLDVHLYGGLLFLLLVLMHTGFGLPFGVLNTVLWVAALWVVGSGVVGVALQSWIPRLLEGETAMEVHHERIPELMEEVRTRARQAASEAGPRLQSFYERELSAELEGPRSARDVLLSRGRSIQARAGEFDQLARTADAATAPAVEELRRLHRAKLDLDLHDRLQWVLRGWLYLHLPIGIVLLVLFALHLFFILYF